MPDTLGIWNQALGRLRARLATTTNPGSVSTPQELACDREWVDVRRAALGSYPWQFATGLRTLSADAAAPPKPWLGKYAVNSSDTTTEDPWIAVLAAFDAETGREKIPFRLVQEEAADSDAAWLYADTDQDLLLEVVADVGTEVMPSWFYDLLAWRLAAKIAMPLTGNRELANDALQKAELAQIKAEDADRRQRGPRFGRTRLRPAYSPRFARLGGVLAPVEGETP